MDHGCRLAAWRSLCERSARRHGLVHEAEDCASAFVHALLKDGREDDDALIRFRMRCHVIDALRADRRCAGREEPLIETAHEGFGDVDRRMALRSVLEDALDGLSPQARRLVVRHYLEGLTLAEIAGETGLSVGAVEQALRRARARMQERLSRDGYDVTVLNEF